MNSFKSIAILGVLAVIAFAFYHKMNSGPEPVPPEEFTGSWDAPPTIEIPGMQDSTNPPPLSGPSTLDAPTEMGRSLPRYDPQTVPSMPAVPPSGRTSGPDIDVRPETSHSYPSNSNAPTTSFTPPLPDTTSAGRFPPASGVSSDPSRLSVGSSKSLSSPSDIGRIGESETASLGRYATSPPSGTGLTHSTSSAPSSTGLHADGLPYSDRSGRGLSPGLKPGGSVDEGPTSFATTRREANNALDRGDLPEALRLLSRSSIDPSLSPIDRRELDTLLSQLAGTVIYSNEHHLEPIYVVQAGDTLERVAEKYHIPGQLLARINGIVPTAKLEMGQQLKVIRGPFSAVVGLEQRTLALTVAGYYAGKFRIGLGTEREVMEGDWVVKHKMENPIYFGPDRVIAADDKSNPLGEHWLGLASPNAQSTVEPFGIHGSSDAEAIDSESRGYIRLAPRDAADVYDILSVGSKVIIRR